MRFTPKTKGAILRALLKYRFWKGSRAGVAIAFELSDQPNLEGDRIKWTARINGDKIVGTSGTVTQGTDEIERVYREKTTQRPPPDFHQTTPRTKEPKPK